MKSLAIGCIRTYLFYEYFKNSLTFVTYNYNKQFNVTKQKIDYHYNNLLQLYPMHSSLAAMTNMILL